jgi:hypothetical protein
MFTTVYIASLAAFTSLIPLAASKVWFKPNITSTIRLCSHHRLLLHREGKLSMQPTNRSRLNSLTWPTMGGTTRTLPIDSVVQSAYRLLRNPNLFSKQVVQNLYDISGAYPIFRIGGSTQNSAVYFPNQTQAIIDPFDSVASDQPSKSMIGPAFMQSFQQFPKGSKYIYGRPTLNFARIQVHS